MKWNANVSLANPGRDPAACRGLRRTCQKAKEQVASLRAHLLQQSTPFLEHQKHLVRLALNEAESLAWQTRYPHLVFPALAQEKLGALDAWRRRQEAVRQKTIALRIAE